MSMAAGIASADPSGKSSLADVAQLSLVRQSKLGGSAPFHHNPRHHLTDIPDTDVSIIMTIFISCIIYLSTIRFICLHSIPIFLSIPPLAHFASISHCTGFPLAHFSSPSLVPLLSFLPIIPSFLCLCLHLPLHQSTNKPQIKQKKQQIKKKKKKKSKKKKKK